MTKLALITGENRGLGRNVATSIAKAGGDVIITHPRHQQSHSTWQFAGLCGRWPFDPVRPAMRIYNGQTINNSGRLTTTTITSTSSPNLQ